jgi:hypothetical protein
MLCALCIYILNKSFPVRAADVSKFFLAMSPSILQQMNFKAHMCCAICEEKAKEEAGEVPGEYFGCCFIE